jgi:MarR family transcriptional regulator, organic hydroperoxide resistance regulator
VSAALHDTSTPAGQLGSAFKRAMVAVRKLRGRETHHVDQISHAQYGLLFGLAGECELSARELAEHVDLTPGTVTQMLDHLEAAGLVKRTRSAEDRRIVLSTLTERGAQVVADRHARMEVRWQDAIADFSDAELTAAAQVLNRLADLFDTLREETAPERAPAA